MFESKKEKFLIYASISIIITIVLIVIFFIWKSIFTKNNQNDINNYDVSLSYISYMEDYYENYLLENLKHKNFDTLYEKIDKNYLKTIGLSDDKEEIKRYLRDNNYISNNIVINNIECSTNNKTYAFRVSYNSYNVLKYVNIIETSPYNYTINFEQSNLSTAIKMENITKENEGVKYSFNIIENMENSIKYEINIENNSSYDYTFDFTTLNSIQLRYDTDKYVNMALIANSSDDTNIITPRSSKKIEVLFNIPFEYFVQIDGILFKNVIINGNVQDVEISF